MSNDFSLSMKGIEAVLEKLNHVDNKVQTRVARKAGLAGARVILKRARANAPRRTGVLRRALVAHTSKKRTRPGVVVTSLVRVRSGRKERGLRSKKGKDVSRDAFYAGWVEFGHRIVPRDPSGKTRLSQRRREAKRRDKRVLPNEFLTPAYRATQQQVLNVITAEAEKELAKP